MWFRLLHCCYSSSCRYVRYHTRALPDSVEISHNMDPQQLKVEMPLGRWPYKPLYNRQWTQYQCDTVVAFCRAHNKLVLPRTGNVLPSLVLASQPSCDDFLVSLQGQCCSEFGVCSPDSSFYCSLAGASACQPDLSSLTSSACRKANARLPKQVRRYTLTITKGRAAPDGLTRQVRQFE